MNIKLPAGYDISHWKRVPDFKLVNPIPLIFITKATEGISFIDDTFIDFASRMMDIQCYRGFYHFNRKVYDGKLQGEHFVNTINKIDVLPTDILILDIEEGGEKASQLWAWHEAVRKIYPNHLRMNYSRANILNPIVMTESEKAYFKRIWSWTAGYPYFPDLYSSVPKGYIPDQSKYGPVGLWQYSAHGKVIGIEGDCDLNWINPDFIPLLGNKDLGELVMTNYIGTCKEIAKVWTSIGGARIYPDVRIGQPITADSKQGEYLHLTLPVRGWSKSIWFDYHEVTTPPPPPPVSNEYIIYHKDGIDRKFIPE